MSKRRKQSLLNGFCLEFKQFLWPPNPAGPLLRLLPYWLKPSYSELCSHNQCHSVACSLQCGTPSSEDSVKLVWRWIDSCWSMHIPLTFFPLGVNYYPEDAYNYKWKNYAFDVCNYSSFLFSIQLFKYSIGSKNTHSVWQ